MRSNMEHAVSFTSQKPTVMEPLAVVRGDAAKSFGELQSVADLLDSCESQAYCLRNHSEDVAEVSRALAESLGFEMQMVEEAFLAGLLHDVGKIHTPPALLF